MARGNQRWGIFVHDPDGDMGEGRIVGAFRSAEAADRKAEQIQNFSMYLGVECIVLPLEPGSAGAKQIAEAVV
jgi:hypothetical protein